MSRIIKVEVGRFDYDFVGEFKFFKPGPDGVVRRPSVLVRLTDEDGTQGWGQAVPVPTWTYETEESVESTLVHYLAETLLGADPNDLEEVHSRMENAIRPGFTVGQPLCKAAIDIACHDLAGQQGGLSVSQMLGGAKLKKLTLSWTVASPNMGVVEQQLQEGWDRGYRNFNIKVGPPQTREYDLALARKVRSFASDGFLWADANTGYDLDTALEMLPRLADMGVDVLESPLPPTRFRGYQALKRQGALPIVMDEGIIAPAETAEFIALGMVDGITLKTARSAGLWNAKQIVDLVMEKGMMLLGSGLTDPDLSLMASVHLFAYAGITKPCALNGPQFLANTLGENGFLPEAGEMGVPGSPGLGLKMGSQAEAVLTVAAEGLPEAA